MGTFAQYNGLQDNPLFPMPPISNAANEAPDAPFPGTSLDTSTGLNFGPETMSGIGLSDRPPPPPGVSLGQPPDIAPQALMNAAPPAPAAGRGFAGAFGDAATAFGLGLQGRNPMEAMNQRAESERRGRLAQLAEHTEYMKAIDFGVQKLQTLSSEDRANFLVTYGRQLDELKPGLSETMKAMAKRPDISALLGKYGDADVVKAHLALDPSGRSFREALTKPEFHKQIEQQLDQKALPIVGRKLDLMRQRWQQFTPPEKVKEYMADGVLDATELMKINAELENHPEEKYRALALSPAEMQVWERQHEGISKSLGIVSPDSAARIREKNLGRDPNAGAKILIDNTGGAWVVPLNGAPRKIGAADGAPAAAPASASPAVAAATVAPTVTAADIAAIPDPQERARAQAALESGSVLDKPLALAPTAPAAAPNFAKLGARDTAITRTPEAVTNEAYAQIINGRATPGAISMGGAGEPFRAAIAEEKEKIRKDLGWTPAELAIKGPENKAKFGALAAQEKDISAIRPYNDMLHTNGDIAIQLAGKAIATDSKLANRTVNWLRQNATDNPDVAEFLAQAQIVSTESARVLNNPRLTGQLTDSARHEMAGIVSGDMPIDSFSRVVKRMQTDGNNRVKAMESQRVRTIGEIKGDMGGKSSGTANAGEWSVVR